MNQTTNPIINLLNLPNIPLHEMVEYIIIYLRKSRKDQQYHKDEDIEMTLKRHEAMLQRYAVSLFGVQIPEHNIYREVVSGTTISERKEFKKVLKEIESPTKRAILVVDLERLGRGDGADQTLIKNTFLYTKTIIMTPTRNYNLDEEADLQIVEDKLIESEKYVKYSKRVMRNGRLESVLEGKFPYSVCPFGYTKKKLEYEKGYVLLQLEEEAELVKLIGTIFTTNLEFNYILKKDDTVSKIAHLFGLDKKYISALILNSNNTEININIDKPGTKIIANYINYLGFRTRTGKYWDESSIKRVLTNEAAHGFIIYGKTKIEYTMKDGQINKSRPLHDEYEIRKGLHDPIYDSELSSAIMIRFQNNTYRKTSNEIKNPLVGLVICKKCGRNMLRRPGIIHHHEVTISRKHQVNKQELSAYIHRYYINSKLSISQISRIMKMPKPTITGWVSKNINNFTVPHHDKWNQFKQVLNINDNQYDKIITEVIEKQKIDRKDSIFCRNKYCDNISTEIYLVEEKIIDTLKLILADYKKYFEKDGRKTKIAKTNSNIDKLIQKEIESQQLKIQKIYDFFETGIYTKKIFDQRMNATKLKIKDLQQQLKEYKKTKNEQLNNEQIKKLLPNLEATLNDYYKLDISQRNKLLKSMINKIYYVKDIGGLNHKNDFKIEINLKIKVDK